MLIREPDCFACYKMYIDTSRHLEIHLPLVKLAEVCTLWVNCLERISFIVGLANQHGVEVCSISRHLEIPTIHCIVDAEAV